MWVGGGVFVEVNYLGLFTFHGRFQEHFRGIITYGGINHLGGI